MYWYRAGWNISATVSWALGAAVGLAAVSTTVHEGPLLALTGGVDCSFILSGLVGGVTYTALTWRGAKSTADSASGPEPDRSDHSDGSGGDPVAVTAMGSGSSCTPRP
ncbi:cytosine permease [Streptomyces sp. NPDC056831]|uniref:cytosine permease n=1 Tax=Streptomyces sp. NPDC056831 TaxID=3345954 RepID=UPI00369BD989